MPVAPFPMWYNRWSPFAAGDGKVGAMVQQEYARRDYPPDGKGDGSAPIVTLPLDLTDYSGRKRQGRTVLLPRWPEVTRC